MRRAVRERRCQVPWLQNLGCSSGQGRLTDIALCSGKSAYHKLVQLLRECAGCSALHDSAWNAPSLNGGRAPDAPRYKWTILT